MKSPQVLSRFVLMFSIASGLSVIANWSEWNQYWNQTIYRVQTVDFNILSHTLPAKLSPILARKRYLELQRTLDSNYGLFGLIITDCKEVDILCQKQKITFASNGKRDWKRSFSVDDLPGNSYDLLRTPSPLIAENTYKDSRSEKAISTTRKNKGEIIGRVYYVRGVPPSFFSDYTNWLTNIWSTKGTHSYYALKTGTFISMGFVVWIAIEFLLYKKYIQHLQATHEKQRLEEQLDELINQNFKLVTKQRHLIAQQEKSRIDLENSRQSYQKRTLQINNDIKRLIDSQSQRSSELQNTEKLLITRQQELDTDRASKLLTLEQLQQREIEVSQLQKQQRLQDNQYQKITDHLLNSQKDLSRISQKLADSEKQKQDFEIKNEALFVKLDRSSKEIDELKQRLTSNPNIEIELKASLESAKQDADIMEELYEQSTYSIIDRSKKLEEVNLILENDRDDLQLKVWDLEEENTWYSELINKYHQHHLIDLSASLTASKMPYLPSLRIVIVGGPPFN